MMTASGVASLSGIPSALGRLGAVAVDRGTALKAFVRQGHRKNGCHQQSAGTGSAIGDRNTQQQSLVDIIVFRP